MAKNQANQILVLNIWLKVEYSSIRFNFLRKLFKCSGSLKLDQRNVTGIDYIHLKDSFPDFKVYYFHIWILLRFCLNQNLKTKEIANF